MEKKKIYKIEAIPPTILTPPPTYYNGQEFQYEPFFIEAQGGKKA
jgi:hypothetical protein